MPTLAKLLTAPDIRSVLVPIEEAAWERPVVTVRIIQDLASLDGVPTDTLLLLTASTSTEASTYRFDMALRVAAAVGVAAIVLTDQRNTPVSPTAASIARRARAWDNRLAGARERDRHDAGGRVA